MSKITTVQVREILNKIYYHCEDIPRQEDMEQYFLQQEKQEKLLGYYKDLAEVRKELYDLTINFKQQNKDRMIVLFTQENLVSDIIKELENNV